MMTERLRRNSETQRYSRNGGNTFPRNRSNPARDESRREDELNSKSMLPNFLKLPKKISPTNSKANKALNAKDYRQALKYLDELVRDYPDSYNVRCDRSEVYFHLGNNRRALDDATSALKRKPDKSRAYYIRGFIFDRDRDYMASLKDLSKGLNISPDDSNAHKALKICARIHYEQNKLDLTISELNKALKFDPFDTWVLQTRGEIYFTQRKYHDSLEDLTKLLLLEPDNHTALILKGLLYKKLERYDDALKDFNEALSMAPMNISLLINRAKILLILGRHNDTQSDLDKLFRMEDRIELNTKAKILKLRGLMFKGLGRIKEARDDFTKALEIKEKASTYRFRSQMHLMLKNFDAALYDLNKALGLDNTDKEASTLRNRVLSQLKK